MLAGRHHHGGQLARHPQRADLLLYCTALGSILGFFMMYLRLRRVRRDLTVLTRQIAIRLADRQAAPEIDQNDQPSGGSLDC